MAHVALTALCERRFTDTADTQIALFPIHDQEEPEWRQRLEAPCNLSSPQFSIGWAQMAKYMQYLFNIQHNTGLMVIEQHAHLNVYKELADHTS
jgi:hypothetical protein